jgi:peptide/nickel transport system substrate-binding protein
MCVTWKLRSGVTWQDGSKFTSHDVCATDQFWWLKYGLNAVPNPTGIASTYGWDQTIGCSEDSPTQATISFKSIFAPYLLLGSGEYGIIPSTVLDKAFATNADLEKLQVTTDLTSANPAAFKGTTTLSNLMIGTGPYVVQSFDSINGLVLVKNQHYWNSASTPHIDKIIFKYVSSSDELLRQVQAGEVDYGINYDLTQASTIQNLKSGGNQVVQSVPQAGDEELDFNMCSASSQSKALCGRDAWLVPALGDVKFRHAVIEAINRQQLIKAAWASLTSVPPDSPLSIGSSWAASPTVPTTAYNPTKAEADLDAAGYTKSQSCGAGKFRVDLTGQCINLKLVTTSGNPQRQLEIDAIAANLETVGIQVTEETPIRSGQLFGTFKDGGTLLTHHFDLALYGNGAIPGEPSGWTVFFHGDCGGSCPGANQIPSNANGGQGLNNTGVYDPQLDQALDAAGNTLDLQKRKAAYQEAGKLLAQDLPIIPLAIYVNANSYTSRLHGVVVNDTETTWDIADWYCTGGNCQR